MGLNDFVKLLVAKLFEYKFEILDLCLQEKIVFIATPIGPLPNILITSLSVPKTLEFASAQQMCLVFLNM